MIIRPMEPEDADSVAQIEGTASHSLEQTGILDAMRLRRISCLWHRRMARYWGINCTYVSFDEEAANIAVKNQHEGKGVGASYQMPAGKGKESVLSALCSKPSD